MGFNSGFKGLTLPCGVNYVDNLVEFSAGGFIIDLQEARLLTFICPCIVSISLKYNQKDAKFSRSIYFYKLLYMVQAVPPPIVRSTKLYI